MEKKIEQEVDAFFAVIDNSSKEVFEYFEKYKGMTQDVLKEKIKKAIELWEAGPNSPLIESIEAPFASTSPTSMVPGVVRMRVWKKGKITEECLFFEENRHEQKLLFYVNVYGYTRQGV